MSPDKDAKLRADYPLVFQKPLINDSTIQCGDGWHYLLDRLCSAMNEVIAELVPEADRWRYAAEQVKEKFGRLRFYLVDDNPGSHVAPLIRLAERASANCCDVCGEAGTLHNIDMLIAARCEEHAKQRQWP